MTSVVTKKIAALPKKSINTFVIKKNKGASMKYLLKYMQDFQKFLTLLKTACLMNVSDIFSRSYGTTGNRAL